MSASCPKCNGCGYMDSARSVPCASCGGAGNRVEASMSARGWKATHRLIERASGTPADDLMEVAPGAYVAEAQWKRLMIVTPEILPSFDFVPVLVGK